MDYKGFKKVQEDDDKAILRNKNGHSLTIAKKALSSKHLEGLKNLPLHKADGGGPQDDREEMPRPAPEPAQTPQPEYDKADRPQAPVNIFVGGQQQSPGEMNQAYSMPSPPPSQTPPPGPTLADMAQNERQTATQPPAQVPQAQEAPQESNAPVGAIEPPQPQPQQQAVQPEPISTPEQQKQIELEHYISADQATQNDLNNGHITPRTYSDLFASKSTLGKIGTLFGLLVSGAGSGITGQPNAVLSMMNKELENDFEAQKQSKLNAQNLLRIHQTQQIQQAQIPAMLAQKKINDAQAKLLLAEANQKAYALTRMDQNRMALHSLVAANQKLPVGSPQRQQGDNMLAMMYQAINTENFNIADRAASAGALANFGQQQNQANPEAGFQQRNTMLRMSGNAPLAVDAESKHFPGLKGQASGPIDSADKSFLDNGIRFDRQLNDFIDWTKKHSGSLNPSEIKEGVAKAAELQGTYRGATNGGVYKEGEQNFISKIIDSDPTKFFNSIRVLPSLLAISKENHNRLDQKAKNLGFAGYDGFQGKKEAPQEKPFTTNSGRQAVMRNGKAVYVK